jgi:hypothetical protein
MLGFCPHSSSAPFVGTFSPGEGLSGASRPAAAPLNDNLAFQHSFLPKGMQKSSGSSGFLPLLLAYFAFLRYNTVNYSLPIPKKGRPHFCGPA